MQSKDSDIIRMPKALKYIYISVFVFNRDGNIRQALPMYNHAQSLLTLTATVIDTLALYILPDKRWYRESVCSESPIMKKTKGNE